MSATDTYFQFPLCALGFGGSETERLDHIISFGFIEAGISMFRKLDSEIRAQKAEEFVEHSATPKDYHKGNEHHVAAMIGAIEIGILPNSLSSSMGRWKHLSKFRDKFQGRHGSDVLVRMRKDLVFEVRDKQGMSYREFAVLCAVYSCIGATATPVRITKDTVQARMMGYKSQKVMAAEIKDRKTVLEPLTHRQIGYTLDALDVRKFFARARPNARQTYFSHRLTAEQMNEELFKRKTAKARFHATRKADNNNLMDRIKAENKRLAQVAARKPKP